MKNILEQAFPIQPIEAIKSLLTDINGLGQRIVYLNGDVLEIPSLYTTKIDNSLK